MSASYHSAPAFLWAPPYGQYPPSLGWPPTPAPPAWHHVGSPTWSPAHGPAAAQSGTDGGGHFPHHTYAGYEASASRRAAPSGWNQSLDVAPGQPKPWREWYAEFLIKGGIPVRREATVAEHGPPPSRQATPAFTEPPRPPVQSPVHHPLSQAPIQTPPAPISGPTDFAPLLPSVERRAVAADPPEPAEGTLSDASESEPLSPPPSPAGSVRISTTTPTAALRISSSLDALIPPYAARMPPPDLAPLAPRGRSLKKKVRLQRDPSLRHLCDS
ncbi:hypothetical protein DFJ74DRAFT_144599 [Hyaloraphidium curvatum]|nr:hypothetical protein DFJ74DRAFT_144599 [Hyaloraphidium curvatum]